MTNLVQITVKATGPSSDSWTKMRTDAAKAGAQAGDAWSDAFKLRARATAAGGGGGSNGAAGSTGLAGEDKQLLTKLKGYANTPGGIGILGTGSDTSLVSALKRQIMSGQMGLLSGTGGDGKGGSGGSGGSGGTPRSGPTTNQSNVNTTDMIRQVLTGQAASNVTTTDTIKQILSGQGASNVQTTDTIRQMLTGNAPGNVTTTDTIRRMLEGSAPGNVTTTDTIKEKVDDSGLQAQGEKDGKTYGAGFASSLKNALSGLLSSGGGKGGGGGGIGSLLTGGSEGGAGDESKVSGALNAGGIAGGALPGIGGMSGMAATITGLAGALVAVLPAITSVVGGLAGIGGAFLILEKTDKSFAADMTKTLGDLTSVFKSAALPMAKPLEDAAGQIVGFFKQIEPDLKAVFANSAQLVEPLVKGFEALMSGAGPGFLAMIKAAGPVFKSMSGAFGDLGKSLGEMFSDFASDGSGSATMLSGLLGIVASLLPFIGQLGKIMVSALAPAFKAFSGALAEVLPALDPLMKIIGSFAGAVLSDLGSVLGALGSLLKDLAPSFTTLAKVASNLFNTLENTGIFAILGDALESLAKPLANLVNAIVAGLAPALPPLIRAFGDLAGMLTGAFVTILGAVATMLTAIIKAIPPAVLTAVVEGFVILVAAVKTASIAMAALDVIMDMNPFVAIGIAVIALAAVIIKYHTQIWDFIVKTWDDVTSFVSGAWDGIENTAKKVWDDITAFFKTALGDEETAVKNVWNDITSFLSKAWDDIKSTATTIWNDIKTGIEGIWGDISQWVTSHVNTFVGTIKGYWDTIWSDVKTIWGDIESSIQTIWTNVSSWVTSHISTFASDVKSTWATMKSDATSAWNDLKSIIEAPVNFLINTVYDNGIRRLWNDVMGAVGLSSLDLPNVAGLATGGHLNGYGGGDRNLALLEDGETVVSKEHSRSAGMIAAFKAAGVPGYSAGGIIGDAGAVGKMVLAAATGNETAFTNAFSSILPGGGGGASGELATAIATYPVRMITDIVKGAWSQVKTAAGGGAIPTYARSFLGQIPYVWGGDTFKGDDCSGFTSGVYEHFGYSPPRTSEAQGAWVQKTSTPMPGGLAFFNSPDGGPPPGHVGIIASLNSMIDQAGPQGALGPTIDGIAGAMYYGIPPGGFGAKSLDHGGWLPTGTSIVHNGTGRPELVPGPGGAGAGSMNVTLSVGGGSASDQILISLLKEAIRTRGGKVQAVIGTGPP